MELKQILNIMFLASTIVTLLCGGVGGMLISLFLDVREIISGFLTFAKHVIGWANKMFSKYEDFLKKGGKTVIVEVDSDKIPKDIISKEQLAGAKKITLGLLTDKEGTPHKLDTVYVPTEGMDDELRQHLDEGNGVIEVCA